MCLFLKQTSSMKILKPAVPGLFLFCLLFIAGCLERPGSGRFRRAQDTASVAPQDGGRCYGDTPCNACPNCSLCKYCNNGGSCGKCENAVNTVTQDESSNKSRHRGQTIRNGTTCRAITKKGTRCKRSPRESGYCYQHEGK